MKGLKNIIEGVFDDQDDTVVENQLKALGPVTVKGKTINCYKEDALIIIDENVNKIPGGYTLGYFKCTVSMYTTRLFPKFAEELYIVDQDLTELKNVNTECRIIEFKCPNLRKFQNVNIRIQPNNDGYSVRFTITKLTKFSDLEGLHISCPHYIGVRIYGTLAKHIERIWKGLPMNQAHSTLRSTYEEKPAYKYANDLINKYLPYCDKIRCVMRSNFVSIVASTELAYGSVPGSLWVKELW